VIALGVGLAAGLGAVARYVVDRLVPRPAGFPLGILVVNVSGSLLLGIVTGLGLHHRMSSGWIAILGAGVAGGYTTLSTWAWDTADLRQRSPALAATNVIASVAACLSAGAAGLALAQL
jgi:CrcB protein